MLSDSICFCCEMSFLAVSIIFCSLILHYISLSLYLFSSFFFPCDLWKLRKVSVPCAVLL